MTFYSVVCDGENGALALALALRSVSDDVAGSAKRFHVQPVLSRVALVMMVLLGRLTATVHTQLGLNRRELAVPDRMINRPSSCKSFGIQPSHSLLLFRNFIRVIGFPLFVIGVFLFGIRGFPCPALGASLFWVAPVPLFCIGAGLFRITPVRVFCFKLSARLADIETSLRGSVVPVELLERFRNAAALAGLSVRGAHGSLSRREFWSRLGGWLFWLSCLGRVSQIETQGEEDLAIQRTAISLRAFLQQRMQFVCDSKGVVFHSMKIISCSYRLVNSYSVAVL